MILIVVAVIVIAGWAIWQRNFGGHRITSYRDCVKAGNNAVLMTYPAVCITSDGRHFEDPANKVFQPPYEGATPKSQ